MLCRKLKETLIGKSTLANNVQYGFILRETLKRCVLLDGILTTVSKSEGRFRMSFTRLVLKDFNVKKLWASWTRNFLINTVVRRCKRDGSVREVLVLFRHTLLRPRRTFFLSATAAFKSYSENSEKSQSCEQNITDEELQALVTELEGVEQLSKNTLYCTGCGKRVVIEKKLTGVAYCACKDAPTDEQSHEGWVPYMEAEDVIIWRKEYKHGQGLYAYKVYGRYKDVRAEDFAAVQVDGAYRKAWDAAVAALSVVERGANGLVDQTVLHWEVLWPRLFANRDYVYIRRHKEFEVKSSTPLPQKVLHISQPERPSVHSNAKRKAREEEMRETQRKIDEGDGHDNKLFVIISRSCEHPDVPETKHAIRVNEYWSHMVVRSTHGSDKPGMEFVLTYYDEPAVGGLPSGVAAWATGRAAPAYLDRMRKAAADYGGWRMKQDHQDIPDFVTSRVTSEESKSTDVKVSEQDMESSKDGPELENGEASKRDQGTQTKRDQGTQTDTELGSSCKEVEKIDVACECSVTEEVKQELVKAEPEKVEKATSTLNVTESKQKVVAIEETNDKPEGEEPSSSNTGSWWRYLYPFYYFV